MKRLSHSADIIVVESIDNGVRWSLTAPSGEYSGCTDVPSPVFFCYMCAVLWIYKRRFIVERDRLMMLVIAGSRKGEHCFKRDVAIGSKSQFVSGDWERSLETSSVVTQGEDEKLGGVKGRGKWGEVEIRLISKLVWSLWILLEKK